LECSSCACSSSEEPIVAFCYQHDSFSGLNKYKNHIQVDLSLFNLMITLCYKMSILNNFQRQSCLGICLEQNCKKYLEIDSFFRFNKEFNTQQYTPILENRVFIVFFHRIVKKTVWDNIISSIEIREVTIAFPSKLKLAS